MSSKPKVLLVEDSPSLARVYLEYLRNEPCHTSHVDSGGQAMDCLESEPPKVLLLDLKLPDMNGMDILRHIQAKQLPCAVIIITAHGSVDIAVDAMRYGAYDFIEKPFDAERLRITLRNVLERLRLNDMVASYRENFERERYHGFIGSSLPMQAVYRIIDSAAPSKATVFITGESGTGKEVCADAIHQQGERREQPFIALNCGAIPKDLIESEIFGHVKGAFTGAAGERQGAAARADGGTLFLDEIAEMVPDLQTKLLRFVQTGTFQKVGGAKLEKVDVRFVCATNRDPLEEVTKGRFREDLYYRLNVIPIHLPPLRERDDDILAIATHFLTEYSREEGKSFCSFEPDVEVAFLSYDWPGNVRQLQNVVRNIVVLNSGETVSNEMLPPPLDLVFSNIGLEESKPSRQEPVESGAASAPVIRPLYQLEKDAIEQAIEACGGNIPKAAALLEVSPSTLYRKRQTWEDALK